MPKDDWSEIKELDKSLERTAYHEAGHALACMKSGLEVDYATIEPSTGWLGYVKLRDGEMFDLTDKLGVIHCLMTILAGCVAEEIYAGELVQEIDGDRLSAISVLYSSATGESLDNIQLLLTPGALSRSEHELLTTKMDRFLEEHHEYLLKVGEVVRNSFLEDKYFLDLVANRLLERKRLEGVDLEDLIQETMENE